MAINLDDLQLTAEERCLIDGSETLRKKLFSKLERVGTVALQSLDCSQLTWFARACLKCVCEDERRHAYPRLPIPTMPITLPEVSDEVIEKAFGHAFRRLPREQRAEAWARLRRGIALDRLP